MRNRLTALVALSAVAVAGCAAQTPGTPTPAPQASSPAGGNPQVRKVVQPLNPSKFEADPCGLVPQQVMAELSYPNPGAVTPKDQSPSGPYCGWNSSPVGRGMMVTIQTGNRDSGTGGLAGLYAARDSGQMPFLEPAPEVSGYQAVYADRQDRRPRGACNLHIGITDDLDFSVATQGYSGPQDSCNAAQQVAVAVVKTLKGA
jgi:hypothetical protein